jgi:WD40 repeat protein
MGICVNSVSFSPDGKFLASGEWDKTVKVWEVGSWREVATLRGHGGICVSVSFSPDGKFLASGSGIRR